MLVFVDCEGSPVQEFSAIYADELSGEIVDVFHQYVKYSSKETYDIDKFSRHHLHGLNLEFLTLHGLRNEETLVTMFHEWLQQHPHNGIFAHAPKKEEKLLSLKINDICLKPWKERGTCYSHVKAVSMKKQKIPICNVTCEAHGSFMSWKPKKPYCMSISDIVKMDFLHHCSLYDCIECFFFYLQN